MWRARAALKVLPLWGEADTNSWNRERTGVTLGTGHTRGWEAGKAPPPGRAAWVRERAAAQVPILALLSGSCVTLGKGLHISEPQFPLLQNGDIPSPHHYSPGGTAAEQI